MGDGRIYTAIEFCLEAAKTRVIKDMRRFRQIRRLLVLHRAQIEKELYDAGKGMNPPPHEVVDRILAPVHLDADFSENY